MLSANSIICGLWVPYSLAWFHIASDQGIHFTAKEVQGGLCSLQFSGLAKYLAIHKQLASQKGGWSTEGLGGRGGGSTLKGRVLWYRKQCML